MCAPEPETKVLDVIECAGCEKLRGKVREIEALCESLTERNITLRKKLLAHKTLTRREDA